MLLRLVIYLGFLPVFLLHWLGLLLDELFFRGYRKVVIDRPVFILGVPRSGTTFLHRTLAADDTLFTSVSTWEALLAPSITQRVFWLALCRLDRLLGRPGGRLVRMVEQRLFGSLAGVHDMALEAPEEDYLLLMPLLSCFILFLPFTDSPYIWNLVKLDWNMPPEDRQRILRFYRACLQKHLYVHGRHRRYLAKNAAFASWVTSLRDEFPDASLIICLREPEQAVPSLLGSLETGARLFDFDLREGVLSRRLVEMMQDSYRHLVTHWQPEWVLMEMSALRTDLVAQVEQLYQQLGLPLTERYQTRLRELAGRAESFTTRTRPVSPTVAGTADYYRARFPWYYQLTEASQPTTTKTARVL